MASVHEEANGIKSTVTLVQGLIAAILAGIMLWIGTEVTELGKKIERIETLYDAQLQVAEQKDRLAKLERDTVRLSVTGQTDLLRAEISRLSENDRTMWPRLRAHGENIKALLEEVKRLHPGVRLELKTPESM